MTLRALRAGIGALIMVLAGCTSIDQPPREQKTGQPPKSGGSTGAPVGPVPESGAKSAPASPAAVAGSYQDRQEAELRQQVEGSGVRVLRNGENVKLVMPGSVTFGVNSEQIQPGFTRVLDSVALIIRKYDKTQVDIRGFTDATGSFEHNQELSQRRAQSVAAYLISHQVVANRIRTAGYGPRYPIASNASEAGRAQNRRIEIELQQR